MRGLRLVTRLACAVAIAAAGAAGYVLACGPFLTILRPVDTIRPGGLAAYDRGDLGVVRPHFARRYLVQAFRRFNGRPAIAVVPVAVPVRVGAYVPEADRGARKAWRDCIIGDHRRRSEDRDRSASRSIRSTNYFLRTRSLGAGGSGGTRASPVRRDQPRSS
jgi:hypothetical protein